MGFYKLFSPTNKFVGYILQSKDKDAYRIYNTRFYMKLSYYNIKSTEGVPYQIKCHLVQGVLIGQNKVDIRTFPRISCDLMPILIELVTSMDDNSLIIAREMYKSYLKSIEK